MQKPTEKEPVFLVEVLKKSHESKKCNAYKEEKKAWCPANIQVVNTEEQTAFIKFLGEDTNHWLPATYIQPIKPLSTEELKVGKDVEVLSNHDGRWYEASIEAVNGNNITIRYDRWNTTETTTSDSLRLSTVQKKRPIVEREIFEIPESLKINPNDSEVVRRNKKKKVRALKKAWRQRQHEKESQSYSQPWKEFQEKVGKRKVGLNRPEEKSEEDRTTKKVKYTEYFNQFVTKED